MGVYIMDRKLITWLLIICSALLRKYSTILKWMHHAIHVKSGILKMNDFNLKVTYNESNK